MISYFSLKLGKYYLLFSLNISAFISSHPVLQFFMLSIKTIPLFCNFYANHIFRNSFHSLITSHLFQISCPPNPTAIYKFFSAICRIKHGKLKFVTTQYFSHFHFWPHILMFHYPKFESLIVLIKLSLNTIRYFPHNIYPTTTN